MRLAIGFAGVPADAFDYVSARKRDYVSPKDRLFLTPFRAARYQVSDAKFFLRNFEDLIAADHHNENSDVGVVLVYVDHPDSDEFARLFFPAVLPIKVQLECDYYKGKRTQSSLRAFIEEIKKAIGNARDVVACLKKELSERDSKTPLLLPLKNFRSDVLERKLRETQDDLISARDKRIKLASSVEEIGRHYPMRVIECSGRSDVNKYCYIDERGVEFRPPGRDRHAFARPQPGHDPLCLISGRRRLGAPYDRAFHYDCTKGGSKVKGSFYSCHGQQKPYEGNPHLNIAPNDYVRA